MNIYLLSQTENNSYDTYDSCVVIAESEQEARLIHPRNSTNYAILAANYSAKYNTWSEFNDEELTSLVQYGLKYYDTEEDSLNSWIDNSWCKHPEAVTVKYIGEFKGNVEDYLTRIICSSFNAG